MNKDRLETLAAKIESLPHVVDYEEVEGTSFTGFNMKVWACGTVACIGGWAQHLWLPNLKSDADDIVAEVLDISDSVAEELFYPTKVTDYRTVTPTQAAAVIRNLIATGEVDWSIII